jgi:hypothetical protein
MNRTVSALLTALILAFGVQVVWTFAAGWAAIVVDAMSTRPVRTRETVWLLDDGTPIVRKQRITHSVNTISVFTIDRRPLPLTIPLSLPGDAMEGVLDGKSPDRRLPWPARIHAFRASTTASDRSEYWYAIADSEGEMQVVGFDGRSKRLLGYFGRDGFRSSPPPRSESFFLSDPFLQLWVTKGGDGDYFARFHDPGGYAVSVRKQLLGLRDEVVELDFVDRTVTRLWKGADTVDVAGVFLSDENGGKWRTVTREGIRWGTVIRTTDKLHLVPLDGVGGFVVEIPMILRNQPLALRQLAEKSVLVFTRKYDSPLAYLAKLSPDAPPQILEVPLEYDAIRQPFTWPLAAWTPLPVGLFATWGMGEMLADSDEMSAWRATLSHDWPRRLLELAVVLALSVALAAATWRRQRRFGLGQTVVWASFVLLFGVPGWIAYRWHRSWPVLASCAACGARAPRDRDACFRCGTSFPSPGRDIS